MPIDQILLEILGAAIWIVSLLGMALLAIRFFATLPHANKKNAWVLIACFGAVAAVLAFALVVDKNSWEWFLAPVVLSQIVLFGGALYS